MKDKVTEIAFLCVGLFISQVTNLALFFSG